MRNNANASDDARPPQGTLLGGATMAQSSRKRFQEINHFGVDRRGALAASNVHGRELRRVRAGWERVRAPAPIPSIPLNPNVRSRSPTMNSAGTTTLVRPGREQLPVAIDVAVPVETTDKSGTRELAGVEIDVGLAKPSRK